MFLLECTACGRRELRGPRSIERLDHTRLGIVVTMSCNACGHTERVRTGSGSAEPVPEAC